VKRNAIRTQSDELSAVVQPLAARTEHTTEDVNSQLLEKRPRPYGKKIP
jgi:hypothetical protein